MQEAGPSGCSTITKITEKEKDKKEEKIFLSADTWTIGHMGQPKVVQEVLADLKILHSYSCK